MDSDIGATAKEPAGGATEPRGSSRAKSPAVEQHVLVDCFRSGSWLVPRWFQVK